MNKKYKFDGQLLATYLIGYGIIRTFVESFRTDSLMLHTFKVSQLVAIICIVIGITIYVLNYKKISPFDTVHELPESMMKKETEENIEEK